jgi:hypothetical protein
MFRRCWKRPNGSLANSPLALRFRVARLWLEALEDRRLPTVGLSASFPGMDFNSSGGTEPPDSDVAAGPTYIVSTVNVSLAIYNKTTGVNVFQENLANFFAPVGAGSSADMFDPRVTYDDLAGRFVISVLEENDDARTSFLDFAVSNSSDPNQGFTEMHRLNVKETSGAGTFWGDYDQIGWNADVYVFTLNMYSFPSMKGTFNHVQVLTVGKAGVLDQNNATLGLSTLDRTGPEDETLTPAMMHGAAPGGPMWLGEEGDASTYFRFVEMTNVLSPNPTVNDVLVSVPAYQAVVPPTQPGGSKITTIIDSSVLSVVTRGNKMALTQNVGSGGVTRARWYEFDLGGGSPALSQWGEINRGAGVFTYFPAADIAPDGSAGLVFQESSPQENISMYVTGWAATDEPGVLEPAILVKAGQAVYNGNRAGDFCGLSIDPDGHSFWACGEFSNNEATNWGTWLARLVLNTTSVVMGDLALAPQTEGPVGLSGTVSSPTPGQARTVSVNWGDGSAPTTFTMGAGVTGFGPLPHTYAEEGAYTITLTAYDFAGSSGSTALAVAVHDAALHATAVSVAASQGIGFSGVVATFTDDDPNGALGDYSATISWGDGHTSPGVVSVRPGGGFNVSGSNTYTVTPGTYPLSVQIVDAGGASMSVPGSAVVRKPALFATGADLGGGPDVRVFDAYTGQLVREFMAYDPRFTGGVRVAEADITGDGVPDIITGPGPGGGPDVRVWDGATGNLVREFMAYMPSFTGGIFVAAGDINHDGVPDIVTGADAGGGPHVRAFSGADGSVLMSFFAYGAGFRGGVRVAVGDVNADGFADVITGAGAGGGPHVEVFSGKDGSLLQSFFAYSAAFTGGVYVAAGDLNLDGKADIITGAGAGGGPHVEAFSGADGSLLASFFAYDASASQGVRVGAVAGINVNGGAGIVTALGPGAAPDVKAFDATTRTAIDGFFAYDPRFLGGVFVGGH